MAVEQDYKKSLKHQLDLLVELQKLDNIIMDNEEERDDIPLTLEKQENLLYEKRNRMEENESQIHMLQDEIDEKSGLHDLEKLKLENTRTKETAIQNIKEYEAFVKELENQEKSSEEIEEEIKQSQQKLEQLKDEQISIANEINEIQNKMEEQKTELGVRMEELDKILDDLFDQRDELAEQIKENIYYKYEYIAERKNGIGIAQVELGHCAHCNMAIPPQMYNEVIRGDRLMACPACQRILVYSEPEDTKETGTDGE